MRWEEAGVGRWERYQASGPDVEVLVSLWPERGTWDYSIRLEDRGILRAERGGYASAKAAQDAAVGMLGALRAAARVAP